MIVSLRVARRGMESQVHYAVFSLRFKGEKKEDGHVKCEKSKLSCSVREAVKGPSPGSGGEEDFLGNKGTVSFRVCSKRS